MPSHIAHFTILLLVIATVAVKSERMRAISRKREDWVIDLTSLIMHFLALPALQVLIVFKLLHAVAPLAEHSIRLGWLTSLGAYALIDYAWYWNHRLFHADTPFWKLHQVHHSPEELDVFASSRNSLGSHFLMIYFWAVPLVLYLAVDPLPFLSYASAGLIINFWGHTSFRFARSSWISRTLALFIVQPEDHFWHHSSERPNCNYGTVLNVWDRLHGTWYRPSEMPSKLGFTLDMTLSRKLFLPF